MARNGAGTYVLPAGQPVVTGTTISSATHNTLANDLANALTTSIATDGQSVVTANIPLAGYKLIGIGAPTVNGDALRYENLTSIISSTQAQTGVYYTTGGSTTAYTLTPTPALTSLVAGQRFSVVINAANTTTTPTLAISGLAAKSIKVYNSAGVKADPPVGALALNLTTDILYDGTDYVALGVPRPIDEPVNPQTGTTYTYLTTDKGKLVTHSNAAAIAGTLPQAGTSFPAGWWMDVQNRGAGVLTITPTTSTLDGSSTLVLGVNQGARIVSDGTNYFTLRTGSLINARAAVAATSGTEIDFTGILPGAKRVTLNLRAISTNGTNDLMVMMGTSGGFQSTGYFGGYMQASTGGAVTVAGISSALLAGASFSASASTYGSIVFTLVDSASGAWVVSGALRDDTNTRNYVVSGGKSLTGILERIRLSTVAGTDLFDGSAGQANLLVEY